MRAFLILAILAAILAVALGDVCVGIPGSLAIGSSCGNSAGYCRKGSFCSSKSVCTALIKVGGNCSNPLDECVPEAECHGPAGSKLCQALVGVGEDCSNNATLSVAPCAGDLICSNGKCTGAYPGDACTANTDCAFGTCTSGICPFVTDGQSCLTSFQCQPQSYCNQIGGASACAPLPIAGNCTSSIGCGYGYACVAPSATDAKQCVAVGSLTEGTYCDGSHVACKSGVCSRNYCATNPPVLCNSASPSPCGADRYCVCGGLEFLAGFGSCSSVSCTYESKDFEKCWRTNCKSSTTGKGSCATLNCATQYTKLDSCSSASGLFASFTFVSLAVLFISFFSRQL